MNAISATAISAISVRNLTLDRLDFKRRCADQVSGSLGESRGPSEAGPLDCLSLVLCVFFGDKIVYGCCWLSLVVGCCLFVISFLRWSSKGRNLTALYECSEGIRLQALCLENERLRQAWKSCNWFGVKLQLIWGCFFLMWFLSWGGAARDATHCSVRVQRRHTIAGLVPGERTIETGLKELQLIWGQLQLIWGCFFLMWFLSWGGAARDATHCSVRVQRRHTIAGLVPGERTIETGLKELQLIWGQLQLIWGCFFLMWFLSWGGAARDATHCSVRVQRRHTIAGLVPGERTIETGLKELQLIWGQLQLIWGCFFLMWFLSWGAGEGSGSGGSLRELPGHPPTVLGRGKFHRRWHWQTANTQAKPLPSFCRSLALSSFAFLLRSFLLFFAFSPLVSAPLLVAKFWALHVFVRRFTKSWVG